MAQASSSLVLGSPENSVQREKWRWDFNSQTPAGDTHSRGFFDLPSLAPKSVPWALTPENNLPQQSRGLPGHKRRQPREGASSHALHFQDNGPLEGLPGQSCQRWTWRLRVAARALVWNIPSSLRCDSHLTKNLQHICAPSPASCRHPGSKHWNFDLKEPESAGMGEFVEQPRERTLEGSWFWEDSVHREQAQPMVLHPHRNQTEGRISH